jgi:hypothetical protein
LSHSGRGQDAVYKVQWSTGDVTWVPFIELKGSAVLDEYDEAMGIRDKKKNGMHGPELGMSPIRVEGQSEWGKVKAETGGSDLRRPEWGRKTRNIYLTQTTMPRLPVPFSYPY